MQRFEVRRIRPRRRSAVVSSLVGPGLDCPCSLTTTMPVKPHRPSGQVRSHSRTSSGASSKAGLSLQFTQKDPPPPRLSDKPKKTSHFHHEVRPFLPDDLLAAVALCNTPRIAYLAGSKCPILALK